MNPSRLQADILVRAETYSLPRHLSPNRARSVAPDLRMRLFECRVPGVYLTWANALFLAFFAFNGINNLHRVNEAPNSDSPRRHHSFVVRSGDILYRTFLSP